MNTTGNDCHKMTFIALAIGGLAIVPMSPVISIINISIASLIYKKLNSRNMAVLGLFFWLSAVTTWSLLSIVAKREHAANRGCEL